MFKPDDDTSDDDDAPPHIDLKEEVKAKGQSLEEIRREWAFRFSEQNWFYVHHRGGDWTEEFVGVRSNEVAGKSSAGVARDWCRHFKFPKQRSFAYKRYTLPGANELAREYVRRGHHFCFAFVYH